MISLFKFIFCTAILHTLLYDSICDKHKIYERGVFKYIVSFQGQHGMRPYCSGVLIKVNVALLSGHCIYDVIESNDLLVPTLKNLRHQEIVAGISSILRDEKGHEYRIPYHWRVHPNISIRQALQLWLNDFAVLTLYRPFSTRNPNITPLNLSDIVLTWEQVENNWTNVGWNKFNLVANHMGLIPGPRYKLAGLNVVPMEKSMCLKSICNDTDCKNDLSYLNNTQYKCFSKSNYGKNYLCTTGSLLISNDKLVGLAVPFKNCHLQNAPLVVSLVTPVLNMLDGYKSKGNVNLSYCMSILITLNTLLLP